MDKTHLDQIKREGNAFNSGLGVGRALGPDETIALRMSCLAQANETAKLGLSRDVYETAERYYRWAMGEKPELKVELPYKAALIALMEAEILAERTDLEKLREETAECFGIVEDRHWPKKTAKEMAEEAQHWPNLPGYGGGGVLARDTDTGRVLSREETDAVAPDISHLRFKGSGA